MLWVCIAGAIVFWSAFGIVYFRESRLRSRCTAERLLPDYVHGTCGAAKELPRQATFVKRHPIVVGPTIIFSVGVWSVGGWWLMITLVNRSVASAMKKQQETKRSRKKRR